MVISASRFNLYLLLAAALLALPGCETPTPEKAKKDKEAKLVATLRFHIETNPDKLDLTVKVPVYRANPVIVTIEKDPFLSEGLISEVRVVGVATGFMLEVQFTPTGKVILEQYTSRNTRKHIAIFCQFGEKESGKARWLAAPLIQQRISNGILRFTPDATREETDYIALGVNNVIQNEKKNSNLKE